MSFRHFLGFLTLFALLPPAAAAPPNWWATGNPPIITGTEANNRAPANIGQAKWMVNEALRTLDTAAPTLALQIRADLAGTAPDFTNRIIDLTVPNPKSPSWLAAQKSPLLLGQLKAISTPFYTRLAAAYPTWLTTERTTNATNLPNSIFPWTTTPDDDQNKATATLGQLKAVFSLRFETLPPEFVDSDYDGMPDNWEVANGLNPSNPSDAYGDPDGDGIQNRYEYILGFNPRLASTGGAPDDTKDRDGDGMKDWREAVTGSFKRNSALQRYTFVKVLDWEVADANGDYDQDGLTNIQELEFGSSPNSADIDGDGLSDKQEMDLGTSPNSRDSDDDGVPDDIEIRDKTNPNSPSSHGPVIKTVERAVEMVFGVHPEISSGGVHITKSWENSWTPGSGLTTLIPFGDLGAKLVAEAPFPATIPPDTQLSPWEGAAGQAGSGRDNGPPSTLSYDGLIVQRRLWLQIAPAAVETIHRTYMRVTERSNDIDHLNYAFPFPFHSKFAIERVDVTIPKGKTESSPFDLVGDLNGTGLPFDPYPNDRFDSLTAESFTQDFLAVEAAPEVLAVNSDFDEGRIDPTTGYAIPDCDDIPDVDLETGAGNTSLEINAVRNHLDGSFSQGQLVVDDLHPGWFGVPPQDPSIITKRLWVGANVTIRKIDKVDDATGFKESGQVRFYAKWGGSYYGITPYDFRTLEPVNLVSAGINGRPGEGVYGENSTIPWNAKFYMEGVRPGKITLEWRYQKGDIDVKYEQSFEVCTHKNTSEWKAELAYKIRLETSNDPSGQINVLSPNLPAESYPMRMERISEYYDYYQDCFLSSSYTNPAMPQTMSWPGLARLAGSQVVGGLSDAEYGRQFLEVGSVMSVVLPEPITNKFLTWSLSETKALQQTLFSGARTIFNSIGWQMHAYRSSGYRALDWVESETGDPELRALTGVWKNQCIGVLSRNRTKLDKASENITDREQNVTIVPTWTIISGLGFGLVDNMFSVLGRNSCTPAGRNFSDLFPQIPVSTGSLANTVNRWTWIKPTTPNGILDTWNKQPTASRDTLVRRTLEQDARRFSLISHFPDPSPIPLGPLATIPLPVWVWDNKDVP